MIDEENKSATMTEAPAAAAAAPAHAAPADSTPVEPEDTVFSLPLSHVTHDISDLADNEDEEDASSAHRRTCCGTAHSARKQPRCRLTLQSPSPRQSTRALRCLRHPSPPRRRFP